MDRNSRTAPVYNFNKRYFVRKTTDNIIIDGDIKKKEWEQAIVENNFIFPWQNEKSPYTEFRALINSEYFYFIFKTVDSQLVYKAKCNIKTDITEEDRVELFFSLDSKLDKYYFLEIDPLGRVFSSSASYFRKFDLSWECEGLVTFGKITDDGYIVEGAIPLSTLKKLGFNFENPGDIIMTGIFRAEFSYTEDNGIVENWISWVNPGTEQVDFHIPEAFGYMVIE